MTHHADPQRGLGKFEFAVVLAIFGILAGALLNRLIALERETEQLEVALTIRHINVGLKLAIGEKIMRGEDAHISELLKQNPLNFLESQKVGAASSGRFRPDGLPAGKMAGGWDYDATTQTLTYRPRQPEAFDGRAEVGWHFVGSTDALGRTVGLRLEPLK